MLLTLVGPSQYSGVDTGSAHLCDSVALLARWLASNVVGWDDIRVLMVSQLIALDKCPGSASLV